MNLFFSCNKSHTSTKNILENQKNLSNNKEEKINKKNLLQPTNELNYNNDSAYNLEIIDYPYSLNYNDENTVTMNSGKENNDSKNKTIFINNLNPLNILQEERNNRLKFLKNNLDTNNLNESSIINNNDDNIPQNKMMLNNYYINYNIININNINNRNDTDIKDKMNSGLNINKSKEKISESNSKVKVDYPNTDSGVYLSRLKNNIYYFKLNKTFNLKKKLSNKIKLDFKKYSKIKYNKTIEIPEKNMANYKSNKSIEASRYNKENISKINLKEYNTSYLYQNKSFNNISLNKINIRKLKSIKNKNDETQKVNFINSRKTLNKSKIINAQSHKTNPTINPKNKNRKRLLYLKKNAQTKRKAIYISNSGFKITLLNKMNEKLDNIGNITKSQNKKNIIRKIIKNKYNNKKLENKNKYINPFREPFNDTIDESALKTNNK